MRRPRFLSAGLALGFLALAACGDQPTQPSPTNDQPATPELAVARNTWLTRANMPASRTDLAVATLTNAAGQSILYAIGGRTSGGSALAKVTAYNVATNTWTFRRPMPAPRYRTNGAGVLNGKIYVSGGGSGQGGDFATRGLYMYDPATNTWTQKRDMPAPGAYGVTGVIRDRLYVVTICDNFYEPEDCSARMALYRYNPVTDRWTTLAPPPRLFTSFNGGGVIGGKLYVHGNYGPDGRLAVYDPATNQWSMKTPLGVARSRSATAVAVGKLYVMGGTTIGDAETLAQNSAYDPTTDTWTRRAPLPSPRAGIAAAKVFLDGKPRIEVVGGEVPGNNLQYVP